MFNKKSLLPGWGGVSTDVSDTVYSIRRAGKPARKKSYWNRAISVVNRDGAKNCATRSTDISEYKTNIYRVGHLVDFNEVKMDILQATRGVPRSMNLCKFSSILLFVPWRKIYG